MSLPTKLQACAEYPDDIRDENGDLVASVYSGTATPKEIRDEIVVRWNSYTTLRETLATVNKLLDDVFQN